MEPVGAIPLFQIGNDIFAPLSLTLPIIKEFLFTFVSEFKELISKFYTFMYGFIFQIIQKENHAISKIYKFIFDFDIFSFANFIHNVDFWKILILTFVICIGIYFYEVLEKYNVNLNIHIKQLRIENDLLRNQMETYYNKNNIIADEVDTIHSEVVKCIKKIRKFENQIKNIDY